MAVWLHQFLSLVHRTDNRVDRDKSEHSDVQEIERDGNVLFGVLTLSEEL